MRLKVHVIVIKHMDDKWSNIFVVVAKTLPELKAKVIETLEGGRAEDDRMGLTVGKFWQQLTDNGYDYETFHLSL